MFLCIAPRAPAVATNKGATIHPRFAMSLMRGSYFVCLFVILSGGNLSWQYVNSTNCIMLDGCGSVGCGASCGWFSTSSMSGRSFALHWHCCVEHVHGSSHGRNVFSEV